MIIQKNDLQISRIKRVKYGSYSVGVMKQGDFEQVEPDKLIMKEYFTYKKKLIKDKQGEIKEKVKLLQEHVESRNEVMMLGEEKARDVKMFDRTQLIKNLLSK